MDYASISDVLSNSYGVHSGQPRCLYAFDLDGTLIKHTSSYRFYFYALRRGVFSKNTLWRCVFELVQFLYKSDLQRFHDQIFSILFKGIPEEQLEELAQEYCYSLSDKEFYQPALKYLQFAQNHSIPVIILSSSPSFLVQAFVKRLGIAVGIGSEYLVSGNGVYAEPGSVLMSCDKAKIVRDVIKEFGCCVTTFSNHHSDIDFLLAGHYRIAVNPSNALKRIATKLALEII